jgi:hypothetical protein
MEGQQSKTLKINKDEVTDIFHILKNIKKSETNKELVAYFKFAKFYGLLDPLNSAKFEEALSRKLNYELNSMKYFSVLLVLGYMLYRKNYNKAYFYSISVGLICGYSYIYLNNKEFNFVLLQMKDDYINRLDQFYKEDKNPLILNPNFLSEDLVDPNLTAYQSLLKMNSLN